MESSNGRIRTNPNGNVFYDGNSNNDAPEQPDMVRAAGYPAETFHTTTADGYILALHRIPRGKDQNGTGRLSGAVCYLQHGLMCSSADWVIPTPEKGLGERVFS